MIDFEFKATVYVTYQFPHPSHYLLVMIISVSQDTYIQGFIITVKLTHFILMIHSGMVMGVTPVVPAAHSTILHVSPNTLTTLPLMILNYDCVVIIHYICFGTNVV